MSKILFGIFLLVLGALLTAKTEWIVNNFGRMDWFEAKLGSSGGSRLGYKLMGIVLIIIGLILATGSGDALIRWIASPLIRGSF